MGLIWALEPLFLRSKVMSKDSYLGSTPTITLKYCFYMEKGVSKRNDHRFFLINSFIISK